MKKRRLAIKIMTAVLLTGMLSGCTGIKIEAAEDIQPRVIVIWNYYNGVQKETFDALVQLYNDTEGSSRNVVIEAVSKGTVDELAQALSDSADAKIGSDPLPQISAAYADTAFALNEKGLVADLDQYMTPEEAAEYVDAYLEEGRFESEDTLKLFPTAKSTEVLTVNMTEWDQFALETGTAEDSLSTWEGLAETAEKYYKWSGGRAFFGRDAFANYILIGSRQLGHEIFKVTDGTPVLDFDKETMRKLWDNYYVPYINGYYTAAGKFRSDDLKTGDLAAFVGSTSGAAYIPTSVTYEDGSSHDITCRVFALPNFEGTVPGAVQQGAGMMVLQSDQKTEAAAVEFLKWFTQAEQNLEFSIQSGYLPVKKEANTQEALDTAIEDKKIEVSDIMRQSLSVGIREVQEYELYTTKAFAGGGKVRQILEYGMTDRAAEDRRQIDALAEGGMDRDQAVAQFDTDDNFDNWYEETYDKLSSLGE